MSGWPKISPRKSLLDQVNELAEQARDGLPASDGPLPLRRACEAAGVKVSGGQLAVGNRNHIAMLVPTQEGFRATVDEKLWERAKQEDHARHRLRFVVAHELGHTLFYSRSHPPTRAVAPTGEEENFCHHFANALLVPPRTAKLTPPTPEGIFSLAHRFDVSRQVAAWAVARSRPPLSVLWLEKAPHPTRGSQEAMRVAWSASTKFIPRGESFKSPLADLIPGQHGEATERLRLAGREETMHIEAWRFDHAMLAVVKPAEMEEETEPAMAPARLF